MPELERRVNALERSAAPADGFNLIVTQIVDVGRLDAEGVRCTSGASEWIRSVAETEDQFASRVRAQTVPQSEGLPAVVMYPN